MSLGSFGSYAGVRLVRHVRISNKEQVQTTYLILSILQGIVDMRQDCADTVLARHIERHEGHHTEVVD